MMASTTNCADKRITASTTNYADKRMTTNIAPERSTTTQARINELRHVQLILLLNEVQRHKRG